MSKQTVNRTHSNLDFRFMSYFFSIRDIFHSPKIKIDKSEINSGDIVLDYGCGSGSYTIIAAEVVDESGKVYAVDIHPLAIKKVEKRAAKKKLYNIKTIQTDCDTGLKNQSIDVVMCFDVLHDITDKERIVKEWHRVLKNGGKLGFDDHHTKEDEILEVITRNNLFKLERKIEKFYLFIKI